MLAKVLTWAVLGLDVAIVEVEVDIGLGLPAFTIGAAARPGTDERGLAGPAPLALLSIWIVWAGVVAARGRADGAEALVHPSRGEG